MDTAQRLAAWSRTPPLTLIVDRDADTRKMYAEYLQMSACRIDEAEDGREALAKAIAARPDVIVTETRLPGIDGFALCSLLREEAATRTIPIVVVTGDAFDEHIHRAKNAGADSVLVKPCLPETLFAEIARLLDASTGLRGRVEAVREQTTRAMARSKDLIATSSATKRRKAILNRAYSRFDTTEPPTLPPALFCPRCARTLRYRHSHIGGVNEHHAEQWDYFDCSAGCGTFQYRQRTRKLRRV